MTSHGAICGSSVVDRHLHFVAPPSDKITRGALQLQLRSGDGIQLEEVHHLDGDFQSEVIIRMRVIMRQRARYYLPPLPVGEGELLLRKRVFLARKTPI